MLSRWLDTPALAPLRERVYAMLWLAWLAANLTMWMNDVAAAWLMTSLTSSPVLVALVQTASTLPVFLLGLPSGALADIVDRRRWFAFTQAWVCVVAVVLAASAFAGVLSATWLLVLTFANGIGLALRWPVFAAIMPELVPKPQLPQALALSGIAMNLSRVVGPVAAGALLASAGSASVFALNAVLAALSMALILRWKPEPRSRSLPGERFVGAMRTGLQHVRQSPRMRIVLARIFLFFLQSTALVALLPLVARRLSDAGPGTFTALLAAMGVGGIVAALSFPRWRDRLGREATVRGGTVMHAAMSVVVVLAPSAWIAVPAMAVCGFAWLAVANSLTTTAQLALPNWVRARGMSIYQMALMGGAAGGSLLWGQVASHAGLTAAVVSAAVAGPLVLFTTGRWRIDDGSDEDFSPARPPPPADTAIAVEPDDGPVMVTIEYRIDPSRAADFAAVMQDTRRARLRQGALSWGLFKDTTVPGRYIEYFVDETWVEHLRRLDRFTAADAGLRERRLAFHQGPGEPLVRRYVAETLVEH